MGVLFYARNKSVKLFITAYTRYPLHDFHNVTSLLYETVGYQIFNNKMEALPKNKTQSSFLFIFSL